MMNIQPIKKDRLPHIVGGLKFANAVESFMEAIEQNEGVVRKHSFEVYGKNGENIPKTIGINELRTKNYENLIFSVNDTNECVFACKFSRWNGDYYNDVKCLYNNRWNNFSGRAADIIKIQFRKSFKSLLPPPFRMLDGKRDEIYELIYK